jgi:catechol 2,3-dioxygenase-like lactoylglutathione lyase family enzyme
MSSADASSSTSMEMPEAGTIDMKLEVVTLPVSDVDRAKRFYQSLGWRLDADIAVDDLDAARADLVSRGIEVSGLFHLAGGPVPGPDPQGRSYQTYASFSDPDGNGWLLQEIKTRLPGREWED